MVNSDGLAAAGSADDEAAGQAMPTVRVLIVSGVRLHREGIAAVIECRPGIEALATAEPLHAVAAALVIHPV